MIWSIFPQYDVFIDEYNYLKNTGTDAILEITKTIIDSDKYNTRALVKFDLTDVSSSISSGLITSPKFYLNMRVSREIEIPSSYTLEIYPVSQSWSSGIGKADDDPKTIEGTNWLYRNTAGGSSEDKWLLSGQSYPVNTTGSWNSIAGGGTWYTDVYVTESFSFEVGDIRADVTDIVNDWLDDSKPNEGFIIKRTDLAESDSSDYGSSFYFSVDTHTIYVPRLEILWDDSSISTGSLTEITDDEKTIYLKNLKSTYIRDAKPKMRIGVRSSYPTRTYTTSSIYLQQKHLPTSSYYEIRDAHTEEAIIPFSDDYTKISCDSNGNYINIWTDMLFPERFYKLIFKLVTNGGDNVEYIDNNYIFKVVR